MGWKARSKATAMVAAAALSTGGALVGLAAPAAAAPLANGSFEEPIRTGGFFTLGTGQQIGAWTVVAGTVDHVRTTWQAADGAQSVDLNGATPGRICQVVDTEAGRTYQLAFQMSRNYLATTGTALVTVDSTTTPFTHDTAGLTAADMKWEPRSLEFTADDASATICFGSGSGTGGTGPAVDAITITLANTPPTVTITTPLDGAVYYQGQAVLTDYTCADAEGPVASCVGDLPGATQIDTATLGSHTFTVVATDSDGLTTTGESTYTVVATTGLCRGTALSALGIILGQANAPVTPCVTDSRSSALVNLPLGAQLPWPLSFLSSGIRITAASSTTEITPGLAASESHIAAVTIHLPMLGLQIALAGIHSSARAQLLNGCAPATQTSLSHVGTLAINGQPIVVGSGPLEVPLLVGSLHLNQEVVAGNNIVRRALSLDLPGTALDVVLGETIAGVHCTP